MLAVAETHAALTYYDEHQEEIPQDIRNAEALAATLKAQIPSKLRAKRSTRDTGTATLPPG